MTLAIHISDAVLQPNWWMASWLVSLLLASLGMYRLRAQELPRLAMVTAVFFIASSVHIPISIGRVHLLLTGLVGIIAGGRSGLVILAGLTLQNRLIGHGGLLTIGFNTMVMALPAIAIGRFGRYWLLKRNISPTHLAIVGGIAGGLGVLMTVGFSYIGLSFGSQPEWRSATWTYMIAHVPVLFVEAFLTSAIICYLHKGGYSFNQADGETSSSDTSH